MTQPFDHSRFDWYPDSLGGPGQVQNSGGHPRPPLRTPLGFFTVHYAGAGSSWLDHGDTPAELRGIEMNHARPQGKPNEYNSVSDSAAETWEYAGRFLAAHSGSPWNSTDWGHLALYGLEDLTELDASELIRGIRRARAQCVTAGYVSADHVVLPHNARRATTCPGVLWTNKAWWSRIVAVLTPADFDQPAAPPVISPPVITPPTLKDPNMLKALIQLAGTPHVYAQYTGGYKVWIRDGNVFDAYQFVSGMGLSVIPASARSLFEASGPIMGDRPVGVDSFGIPN